MTSEYDDDPYASFRSNYSSVRRLEMLQEHRMKHAESSDSSDSDVEVEERKMMEQLGSSRVGYQIN